MPLGDSQRLAVWMGIVPLHFPATRAVRRQLQHNITSQNCGHVSQTKLKGLKEPMLGGFTKNMLLGLLPVFLPNCHLSALHPAARRAKPHPVGVEGPQQPGKGRNRQR